MFDIERARKALEETARKEGVSYETVIRNVENAIAEAIAKCQRNGDELLLSVWREIPCVGNVPSPVELVAYLGDKILRDQTDMYQNDHHGDLFS